MKSLISRFTACAIVAIVALSSFGASAAQPLKGSFAWGVEAGGSVDMTANDMSNIRFNANFGYKLGWINFVGLGAGVDIGVMNSCRSYPIYGHFRTNFSDRKTLLFFDMRGGISVNYLPGDYNQTGAYTFCGIGINLASSDKFNSHLVLGYTFKGYKDYVSREGDILRANDLHMATVGLGITF